MILSSIFVFYILAQFQSKVSLKLKHSLYNFTFFQNLYIQYAAISYILNF